MDGATDRWGLAVSPATFERQLMALGRVGAFVSLDEIDAPAVGPRFVVTFDDGYRDNLEVAAPILQRLGIPAALFAVSGAVGSARPFWWDELEEIASATPAPTWAGDGVDSDGRFRRIWRALRDLPDDARAAALTGLRGEQPEPARDPLGMPMTAAELSCLHSRFEWTIGSHTVSHAYLVGCDAPEVAAELRDSRRLLSDIIGRQVDLLSFPFGMADPAARRAALDAGYQRAFLLGERRVTHPRRPVQPRFSVVECAADELVRRLFRSRPHPPTPLSSPRADGGWRVDE